MLMNEHQLRIPAQLEHIEAACDFVGEVARVSGLNDDAVYHCRLSVEEICTNIIEHGYAYNAGDAVIDIHCHRHPASFSITVVDDAPAFDPLSMPDPDPATPLWERQGGGWGIYFVKKFMDRVTYARSNNRNAFTIEKKV
jgi:serine/threonine-protein kinase RsbW